MVVSLFAPPEVVVLALKLMTASSAVLPLAVSDSDRARWSSD